MFQKQSLAEESTRQLGKTFQSLLRGLVGPQNVQVVDLIGADSRYDKVEAEIRSLEQKVAPDDIVTMIITTHGWIRPSGEMMIALRDSQPDGTRALKAQSVIEAINRLHSLTQVLVLDISDYDCVQLWKGPDAALIDRACNRLQVASCRGLYQGSRERSRQLGTPSCEEARARGPIRLSKPRIDGFR